MDRYTDKKITSIAIQLEKLGIDFIHFYKYDFASNHIGKEPGVEIDWFFQNSILFKSRLVNLISIVHNRLGATHNLSIFLLHHFHLVYMQIQ